MLGWILLCNAVGLISGFATESGDSPWYLSLDKPSWNPPSQVFAPVWISLYTLMGVAAWRVWRRGGLRQQEVPFTLFGVQLALNFAWSFIFFGAHQVEWALAEIVVLWFAIALTMISFVRIDRLAALLLLPYLAWVTFATALNAAIAMLN